MKYRSTDTPSLRVTAREAVLRGQPEDGSLYMPVEIPRLPDTFWRQLPELTRADLALAMIEPFFSAEIARESLAKIAGHVAEIPVPVVEVGGVQVAECYHGPTGAFKDFGARFLAGVMGVLQEDAEREVVILVATSGDTGGAVAAGFYRVPGIRVVILYPAGKVSPLQERQLTCWGENITAVQVDGSFDDCQALVKRAFADPVATGEFQLSSANSINIARLIPQSIYYVEAYRQVAQWPEPIAIAVPCGNLGNLSAGVIAEQMGMPVHTWIAATNANHVLPDYLASGIFQPRSSVPTLANAMDVGHPSNFARLLDLHGSTWNIMRERIKGDWKTDEEITRIIQEVYTRYNYLLDPHGAIGWSAMNTWNENYSGVRLSLETAHPAKFQEVIHSCLNIEVASPAAWLNEQSGTTNEVPFLLSYADLLTVLRQKK